MYIIIIINLLILLSINSGIISQARRSSAPRCMNNYNNEEQVPVFRVTLKPDEPRHACTST